MKTIEFIIDVLKRHKKQEVQRAATEVDLLLVKIKQEARANKSYDEHAAKASLWVSIDKLITEHNIIADAII